MKPTVRTTVAPDGVLATPQEAVDYVGVSDTGAVEEHLNAAHEHVDGPRSLTQRCFRERTFEVEFQGWVPPGWCRYVPGGPTLRVSGVQYETAPGRLATYQGSTSVATRGDHALLGMETAPGDALPGGKVVVTIVSGPAEADALVAAKRAVLDACETFYRRPGILLEEALNRSVVFRQFIERWSLTDPLLPLGAVPWPG